MCGVDLSNKKKTDKPGIIASMKHLEELGYTNIENIHHPSDLRATKNGDTFWFEVKYTESVKSSFGAATMTEWECALRNPEHFFFLIANKPDGEDSDSKWKFHFISPKEFMEYSTIPPFKVYFRYPLDNNPKPGKRISAIPASEKNLEKLLDILEDMRQN